MSEFRLAAIAAGVAASLMTASSAYAIDAAQQSPETQAVALVSGGVAAKAAADPSCPTVTLAPDGDSRRADAATGAKATLDGLARDCANLGAETILKVALVGEGERRKDKGAAAFDAPLTLHVKDAQGREVETRRINVKVEMPEGVQKVSFRHVEENVSLPPPAAGGYANWTIVVGLDPEDPAVVATDAEAAESDAPRATRQTRSSRKYRTARSRAVNRARTVAQRQQPPVPQQSPVVVSAKPSGAPATITTTTANGSPMARAAASFTENRDRKLNEARVQQAQQAARARQAAGQPPRAQQQSQQAQRPAVRTAQTETN